MPSDANGVYSLPDGYLAVTGETIQASQHNPPLEDIASSMTVRLMRSGAAPMTGPLKTVDGAVGAPAVQFNNATSTGFYKTANGIGISINGTKVAEFTSGGLVSGARWIGELVPFTGLSPPPLTVVPYGQTLSRTTYADLWAFAQVQIATGTANTFYNNGDGSTTFGIGDLRGRVVAGTDNMGGSAASRLTATWFGANGSAVGSVGGLESHLLTIAETPAHTHANSLNDPGHNHSQDNYDGGSLSGGGGLGGAKILGIPTGTSLTGITITNASAGGGAAHNNVQPTIITHFVLFAGA